MPANSVDAQAWRTAAAFRRLQVAGRAQSLDPAEWSLLTFLACEGEATKGEITAELALQTGSLSNAITRLVDRDLVAATKAPEGGRRKTYCLAEDGKAMVERLRGRFQEVLGDHE